MSSRRKIAIIAPVLVAIIVIVPLVYEGYFDPIVDKYIPISVRDGHENVTYLGDFNVVSSTDPFYFSTNPAVSVVGLTNHLDSYLNVSLLGGQAAYMGPRDNFSQILLYIYVSGHFVGLHPYSMTIFFAAVGPNQSSVIFGPGFFSNKYQNVSPRFIGSLGYFTLAGPGNVSAPVPLLNDSGTLHSYNFALKFSIQIFVKMTPRSSHLFEFGARVNSLNKPIISTVNMSMVEGN